MPLERCGKLQETRLRDMAVEKEAHMIPTTRGRNHILTILLDMHKLGSNTCSLSAQPS